MYSFYFRVEAPHDQTAAINHAYDVLTDSVKGARYDWGFAEIFIEQPEDPAEVYKREFRCKCHEK